MTTQERHGRRGSREGRSLILISMLVGGHGLIHVFSSAFFVLIPEIKFSLALTNIQVGYLSAARHFAGGLANPPAGFVTDRFNTLWPEILGISIIGYGIAGVILGLAPNIEVAMLAAVATGLAHTSWHPPAVTTLSNQFDDQRGFALSLHGSGGSAGETIGPTIVGFLIAVVGWRLVAGGAFVPALLSGIAVWLFLRPTRMTQSQTIAIAEYMRSVYQLLRHKHLLLAIAIGGGFGAAQNVLLTFLPIYLREDIGLSSSILGLYMSLAQVAGILSQPLMGYLSDRFTRKIVLVPAFLSFCILSLALYFSPPGLVLMTSIAAMGIVLFSIFAIILALTIDSVEREFQAMAVSLVAGTSFMFAAIAPTVAGAIGDAFGTGSTFLFGAGIGLMTAIISTRIHDS